MQRSKSAGTDPLSTGPKQLATDDEAGPRASTGTEPMTNDDDDDDDELRSVQSSLT